MEAVVHDALKFYQRDLVETENEGRAFLEREGILSPDLVEDLGLGWCSGKLKNIAGSSQVSALRRLGLMNRQGEIFLKALTIPVLDPEGRLVDILGIRPRSTDVRMIFWKKPPRGLLGADVPGSYQEAIFCERPVDWLYCRSLGHRHAVGSGDHAETLRILDRMRKSGIRKIHYLGKRYRKHISIPVHFVTRKDLAALPIPLSRDALGLDHETANHFFFRAKEILYRVERGVPGKRALVKAEKGERRILDRVDFTSASSRLRYAKIAARRLQMPGTLVEEHLADMADHIDREYMEKTEEEPELTLRDRKEAQEFLARPDLVDRLCHILTESMGYVGEETNKRLCVLTALSRLLDQPLGMVLRGPAGSGKSALMNAVSRLLHPSQLLVFSRLTPQALYFIPKEMLLHRLLVVDEYEGVENEYALRTMMSSQTLSLAITVREGGQVPLTRVLNVPARLAVMVSSTQGLNTENLSRFIEIGLDSSAQQNRRVMEAMTRKKNTASLTLAQNANLLLRPCEVTVPFARDMIPKGGNVLVRRKFSHVLGLVKAHAALHQFQRKWEGVTIQAERKDYEAVEPLLSAMVDHVEEDLSPSAMKLLDTLHRKEVSTFSREDVMTWLGWSYSMAYRTLRELHRLELIAADHNRNGVKRVYEVSPYYTTCSETCS